MTSQVNIITDMSSITKIPNKILSELVNKENLCIGSAINDAIISGSDVVIMDIGIGTLSVEIATKQCKFIPSRDLKSIIRKSIDGKIDPLEAELEQAVIEKLMRLYGDIFGNEE